MELEYQFTFKEYLEASRISTESEFFSTFELWSRAVVIVWCGIIYINVGSNPLWGYFTVGFGISYIPIMNLLQWYYIGSLDRRLFWIVLLWQIKVWTESGMPVEPYLLVWTTSEILYWLYQCLQIVQIYTWKDRTNIWQKIVTLKVTESGLELKTANVNIKLKWKFYSHFKETKNLFVIYFYESSHSPHFFPKQAFSSQQLQAFRQLLYSNISPIPPFIGFCLD